MTDTQRSPTPSAERPRLLSEADCQTIGARLAHMATGGGETIATIDSTWRGYVRWARNRVTVAGEDRNSRVTVGRTFGEENDTFVTINETTDPALLTAVRRAEQLVELRHASPPTSNRFVAYVPEPFTPPVLFSEATYQLDVAHRAMAAQQLAQLAAAKGLLSAGYIAVSAHSLARIASWGVTRYFQYTWAQYSVTVRDPAGTGSGWAGVDWPDWGRIDAPALTALAMDKCLRSRQPVAVEPGRYTTILEPQAVCDFVGELVYGRWEGWSDYQALDQSYNIDEGAWPFNARPGNPGANPDTGASKLGERVVDERITISADPLDLELGFSPVQLWPNHLPGGIVDDVYHPVTWIDRGVLTHLAYRYGLNNIQEHDPSPTPGLPNGGAFRMSGGETSLAEMIATTARGLLVTRFDAILHLDFKSLLLRGYTRDGLWLIEQGKIAKPVKNMVFTESILMALNSVEQLGPPQRVFHPTGFGLRDLPQPVIVPPLKLRDFTFTALTDSV